jgi:hypothetical protein
MDSVQNDLQPDIKEETDEEKIDIENHFIPSYPAVRKTS